VEALDLGLESLDLCRWTHHSPSLPWRVAGFLRGDGIKRRQGRQGTPGEPGVAPPSCSASPLIATEIGARIRRAISCLTIAGSQSILPLGSVVVVPWLIPQGNTVGAADTAPTVYCFHGQSASWWGGAHYS
jgi:hypothetical protein